MEKPIKRVKIILEKPGKVCFDMFYRKIEKRLYEYYNNVDAKIVVINSWRKPIGLPVGVVSKKTK